MNFDFSEDQKLLQKSASALLKKDCTLARVRQVMEGNEGIDRELWKKIVDAEWLGTAIPEEYGGQGFGYQELVLIAQELGYALAPVPFASTVYLFAEAVLEAGSTKQKKDYLSRVAKGELIGCFAFSEGVGQPSFGQLKARLEGGKLTGTKVPVIDGMISDYAIVAAKDESGNPALVVVDLKQQGVAREKVSCTDRTRHLAKIDFRGAGADVLCSGDAALTALDNVTNRAAVLFAFEQLGGALHCLQQATQYAKSRYAFGRPIGSFQAIKHKIVDMLVLCEMARVNCYYAAWAMGEPDELPAAAAAARVSATNAFEFGGTENIQVHGGIGFTWEADQHLFLKRSKLLTLALNGAGYWREKLTQAVLAQRGRKASAAA